MELTEPTRQPETTVGAPRCLALIDRLARALETAGVRYCHWKSNEAIARSLVGDNDLDLLIAPEDAGRFLSVLYGLGFRTIEATGPRQVPGIVDLVGVDDPTGRVVHAQAHFRLVVGDDMTKNVHLPFVRDYLASCSREGPLPVPSPEFEYLVLLLRLGLKHCSLAAQLALQGRPTASERRELAYLEARIDPQQVERLRARHLPTVPAELLSTCRRALEPSARRLQRALAGWRVLRALGPYGRRRPATDLVLRVARRPWRRLQRAAGVDARRRPGSGGALIAVVGGDGSGKSTVVASLVRTLGEVVVTVTGHLGKPPRSLTTRAVRRLVRRMGAGPSRAGLDSVPSGDEFPGYGPLITLVLIARDRAREHRRLRRAAGAGAVVVCDRFPLPEIRTMDTLRTSRMPGVGTRRLARRLVAVEAAYYDRITEPDLVLVLRVQPEVAVRRREHDDPEWIRARAREVHDATWTRRDAVVLDAALPEPEVARQARRAVWRML